MSLQKRRALNVSPHSEAQRCQCDAFLMRFTRIQMRSHITSVCCKVFMNILHFLSDLFYNVVSYLAVMEFWTGCLASLNPLWTIIYAGRRMAPHHIASCHQIMGQHNGTKLFDAACNHMRQRMWCGRPRQPMCQCGVSYRWVATRASGKTPVCSYTKESETNGLSPPPTHTHTFCSSLLNLLRSPYGYTLFCFPARCKI